MKATSLALMCWLLAVIPATCAEPKVSVYESPVKPVAKSQLDQIVFAKLAQLGIKPRLCSDAVFVRRAYLDMLGTVPTPEETQAFLDDTSATKRTALIDRLFQRREFADYWSMRWGDVLRIKAEFPINLWPNAAQAYHRWVHAAIVSNMPYDQFARTLLTSSGSNFRVGPVNFYRAIQDKTPEGIATAVALAFMGSRAEEWPGDQLRNMATFFSRIGFKPTREWKEEFVFWDPLGTSPVPQANAAEKDKENIEKRASTPQLPPPVAAMLPDGTKVRLPSDRDPRILFANWLITKKNPWFTASIANRVWGWIMGRGIVEPADDFRADNPPSNPKLLAYLEQELKNSDYDLRHLYRLILTSQTYQLSSVPHSDHPQAAANFACYPLRRLDAEILIDVINKVTGSTDLYTSAIPEPFTYIPSDQTAVAIADGSITSPFLAVFGRSARATGMADERINKLSSSQWLHMLNSSHIQQKIERGPNFRQVLSSRRKPPAKIKQLYLMVLSRLPTDRELKTALNSGSRTGYLTRYDWIDLAWALINSEEFMFRH